MICSICKSEDFVKTGTKTDRQGIWQMYICKKCGHKQKGEIIKKF